jgi:hypothetical protein
MHYKHVVAGLVVSMMAAGCNSISRSIDQRVAVSEECRETLATPPLHAGEHYRIASMFVGDVGRCDIVHDETLLPMCSLAQIRTRQGIPPPLDPAQLSSMFKDLERDMAAVRDLLPDPAKLDMNTKSGNAIGSLYGSFYGLSNAIHGQPERTTIAKFLVALQEAEDDVRKTPLAAVPPDLQPRLQLLRETIDDLAQALEPVLGEPELRASLDAFDRSVSDLRTTMEKLAANVHTLDAQYNKVLATTRDANGRKASDYAARTAAMRDANNEAYKLKRFVADVREAHRRTGLAAQNLGVKLSQQAGVELAAWNNNLRIQLAQLEQLLSGDFNLVFTAGVRDEVLTHVARRSLDLLHGALKPADAVINRLDDKAYGAVSVGYLALGPNIQDAVNGAYNKLEKTYAARHPTKEPTNRSLPTKTFVWELKRAACDNLTQGTQFSMLSELVDTMLILKVGPDDPSVAPPPLSPLQNSPLNTNDAALLPSSPQVSQPPLMRTAFVMRRAVGSGDETSQSQKEKPPENATPLSVYAVNQWMARQQLLTQKISAALANPSGNANPKPVQFMAIETVDEGLVKQIADAATAKAIDDAARLDPSMLDASPVSVAPQIQNSVNVANAANAVSYASAVLNMNLTVSNVNTFSPTNYNNIAPVITIPMPAMRDPAAGSPCASIDFGAIGVRCTDDGGNVVLGFSSRHFQSDSCMPDDLEPALTAMGNMLKAYRARSGIEYQATIQGHASLPPARLARCNRPADRAADPCVYINGSYEQVPVVGCAAKGTDRNGVLSAQRARVAASALERAAEGAVVVGAVQALGSETAGKREAGAPASIDQTVVIRLAPRSKR